MSAFGTKRTCHSLGRMSAFGGEADMGGLIKIYVSRNQLYDVIGPRLLNCFTDEDWRNS